MASYFCSLSSWTLAEWAATGSIIGKETVDPATPSEATLIKVAAIGKKNEGTFNVPTLAGGEKVVAATIHLFIKCAKPEKSVKFGFVSPAVSVEPALTEAAKWQTVSLSKAQAEALTQANLNELTVLLETLLAKTTTAYEVYLALETESGGTGHPVTCGDTVTVSDSAAATSSHPRTAADTITVSESSVATSAKPRTAVDTVSVADAASQTTAHARTTADTITESDTATGLASKGRTAADTVSVSDQASRSARALLRTAADSVSVSESASRTTHYSRTTADSVTVSDAAAGLRGTSRSASDTLSVSDTASRATTAHCFATDGVTIADAIVATSSHHGNVLEVRMRLSTRSQLVMTLSSRKQLNMALTGRPQLAMTLEGSP